MYAKGILFIQNVREEPMKGWAFVIAVISGLAVLASVICIISLVPVGNSLGWDMERVWDIIRGVGATVCMGGMVILILAFGFTYNKPDVPPPD